MTTIRILCTNDFLGSVAPLRTSYGALPGARALHATVDRLRTGQPTIWADAGDFTQGGPLSMTTGGVANFAAAGQLGIDVATIGNHEFDWGLAHLAEHRRQLPFPLLCANVDIGLPASTLVSTAAGPVGFIGLTHPQVAAFTPFAPPANPDTAGIITAAARDLRARGAIAVIVLIHFGVNWSVGPDGTHHPDPTPVLDLLHPVHHAVDAVVLGHTLGRWAAVVDGVPYAQPWAFGAELGVIDLDLTAAADHRAQLVPVDAEPQRWTGTGQTEIDTALSTVVGTIAQPLTIDYATNISLAHFAAGALRAAAGTTAAVVPIVGMHQPAINGVMYHWPAGPVTEADLARLCPWTDDRTLIAELTADELQLVTTFVAPEPWLAWGTTAPTEPTNGHTATIAVPTDYVDWATIQIHQLLGRTLDWRTINTGLRDALRTALAAPTASKTHTAPNIPSEPAPITAL